MGLISLLRTGVNAIVDEINTPESFKLGERFENYVRNELFTDSNFVLVERTHNYNTNHKDYVEASLKPDFTFRDRITKQEFYVEAKVRTTTFDNKIVWCNPSQLKRYNEYNRHKPVFVILDFGDEDQVLSLIPLAKAKYTGLYPSYARQFQIPYAQPVTSKILWNR